MRWSGGFRTREPHKGAKEGVHYRTSLIRRNFKMQEHENRIGVTCQLESYIISKPQEFEAEVFDATWFFFCKKWLEWLLYFGSLRFVDSQNTWLEYHDQFNPTRFESYGTFPQGMFDSYEKKQSNCNVKFEWMIFLLQNIVQCNPMGKKY